MTTNPRQAGGGAARRGGAGRLERAGVTDGPQVALADAGYWNEQHFDEVIANKHIKVLVAPDRGGRNDPRLGWTGGRYPWMRTVLASEHGKAVPQTNTDDRGNSEPSEKVS